MTDISLKRQDEEQAIKRRLFYDGHGSGEDKKIVTLVKSIAKLCLVEHSNEDYQKLHANILRDINLAIAATDRQLKISQSCDKAMENLDNDIKLKIEQIETVKQELSNLELELEYVDRLKSVKIYPDCQTTEKSIEDIERRKQQLFVKVSKYRSNMETLLDSARMLRKILEDDDPDCIKEETTT